MIGETGVWQVVLLLKKISTAETGCHGTGISFCSVCAFPLAEVITQLTDVFQQNICAGDIDSARGLKCIDNYQAFPKKCEFLKKPQ